MKSSPLFFYTLFFSLCFFEVFAQKEIFVDTVNTQYKTNLEAFFTQKVFVTQNPPPKSRFVSDNAQKQYEEQNKEKQKDFLTLIKKGIFVEDKNYTPLLNELFTAIKNGNPNTDFGEIKLLLSVSATSNAYNLGDGIVVINLPLIGKLENRYQLAYVICHEIAHQKKEHVDNSMIAFSNRHNSLETERKLQEIQKQKYNKNTAASLLLKKFVYNSRKESRQKEHEADSLGFVFFEKVYPHHKGESLRTLKILKDIDEQKDSLVKQDYSKLFETANLKFKEEWLQNDAILYYKYQSGSKFWQVDSLRTHPDCDARIAYLKKEFSLSEIPQPADDLKYKKLIANSKKEYISGLYFLEEYGKSLYYALLEIKKNPKDVFLKEMIYNNLVKIRQSRNNYTLNKYMEMESPNFSESYNRFLGFIRNLRKNELNEIISHYE